MVVLTLTLFLIIAVSALVVLMIRKMASGGQSLPVTAEWINDLSTERYKPMIRLLDSADIEFLRSQPGYTRTMEATLRTQRCQIFRGYLRCLDADFQRVCLALKIVMTQSENDRADLASVLLRQQAMFAASSILIQFRLLLYRRGICDVDVSGLVRIFDGMRAELCSLVPSPVAACA